MSSVQHMSTHHEIHSQQHSCQSTLVELFCVLSCPSWTAFQVGSTVVEWYPTALGEDIDTTDFPRMFGKPDLNWHGNCVGFTWRSSFDHRRYRKPLEYSFVSCNLYQILKIALIVKVAPKEIVGSAVAGMVLGFKGQYSRCTAAMMANMRRTLWYQ